MKGTNVQVSLIGSGFMGENHLRHLIAFPDVTVVGVYDRLASQAERIAQKYGVPAAPELEPLLKKSDAVVVCVPTTAHYEVVSHAIQCGCHVFVEKPFMHTLKEAEAIDQLAKTHQIQVQVGHVERFHPVVRKLLESVRMDRLVMAEFYRYVPLKKNLDVDVLLALMVHDLDLMLACSSRMHARPQKILGSGMVVHPEEMNRGLADHGLIQVQFDRPFTAVIHAVRTGALKKREIILTETDQTWVADLLDQQLHQYTRKGLYSDEVEHRTVDILPKNPLQEEMRHFIDIVKVNQKPEVPLQDGWEVMKMIEQIRSVWNLQSIHDNKH
ncbi:Gfo/Idh/MocA family protein [Melghirimyces algeriensis]|uniref:UDP-N-acetylglucosamine 3-dehydrogenase n=1 Tax=Melghirimyces algeriensis TaxID=910412 RepID=A0A521ADE2_9BACL|nr:Gfo/Idh/MocA family oxidoreductase [Melghirimyces algeriensis]SMO32791.1 UDP-N-acetylglucosamine 3-dehydrogenase [Melghirimyces algeriensis]